MAQVYVSAQFFVDITLIGVRSRSRQGVQGGGAGLFGCSLFLRIVPVISNARCTCDFKCASYL